MYLVRAAFDENERMAWMVDIKTAVPPEMEQVRNGLTRTRKNLMLEEGNSRVTLRSQWEEIKCVLLASRWVLSGAEILRLGLKIW